MKQKTAGHMVSDGLTLHLFCLLCLFHTNLQSKSY